MTRRLDAGSALPPPRRASVRLVTSPCSGEGGDETDVIDQGVVLFFPAPRSYTGEDVVELHLHGSVGVVRDTLRALGSLGPEFSMAEPGEFTRRAWNNGKFQDLTSVEAVADLIRSETRHQRKQAMEQLRGRLGDLYGGWSQRIHKSLAHIEAFLDFGQDEMLDSEVLSSTRADVSDLLADIKRHLDDGGVAQSIRNGLSVCLLGRPNVGKSSLLNVLSQTDAAIVSPDAGTTRDVVEVRMDLGGYPLTLQDTAGINLAPSSAVEREGIQRALARFSSSHVRLLVLDVNGLRDREMWELAERSPESTIVVVNKTDLWSEPRPIEVPGGLPVVELSCVSGSGVDRLTEKLRESVAGLCAPSLHEPAVTRERHRNHLASSAEALERFLKSDASLEMAAEDLRSAGRSISRITGKTDIEEVLDIIFKDFCIGK
ncbi:tRNA modification GTPase MnmE-like [Schistocerca gregaria]|uniref:tRNA modification GTPase MnmE-like n=1 Tax=Schistocerca gregaria TaxID=7010 RepID=UPI00211E2B83|nr:tRNA modification GTPase MnmE-like [Schistocerca gregaria]